MQLAGYKWSSRLQNAAAELNVKPSERSVAHFAAQREVTLHRERAAAQCT